MKNMKVNGTIRKNVPKLLLVFIVLFEFSTYTFAQTDFAPIGAKWYYSNRIDIGQQKYQYFTYESVKDTMVNGKNCRKLDIWFYSHYSDSAYYGFDLIYSEAGRVFYYYKNNFQLLYDFNVKPGDTLNLLLFNPNLPFLKDLTDTHYVKYKIRDTGTTIINNEHLKYYKLGPLNYDSLILDGQQLIFNGDSITEKLGHGKYLFGEIISQLDQYPLWTKLLCYFDSSIEYHLDKHLTCENHIIAINDNSSDQKSILLYPNPASENLNLEIQTTKRYNKTDITIVDLMGKECKFNLHQLNQQTFSIDISNLQSGTYFLMISDTYPMYKKIIKL